MPTDRIRENNTHNASCVALGGLLASKGKLDQEEKDEYTRLKACNPSDWEAEQEALSLQPVWATQ